MTGPTLSVATIGFDGFGDEDFAPTFEHAPRLGVPAIEFNAWYPRNLTPAGLDSIRKRCAERGLRPATLQVSPIAPGPDPADLTRETARWLWLIEAAGRLGVTVIKATGSRRDDRGGLPAVGRLLTAILPTLEDRGLTLALENHANNVLELPEDYRHLFAEFDSANVGMCFDTGHFAASGVDLLAVAQEFRHRVVHIDLKDCAEPGRDRFVRFGEGMVDFDAVLGQLTRGGFTGHVVVELPRIDPATMINDLRAGVAIATRFITPKD
jgi:sugar phosphate isomerase/epimerase